MSTTIRKPVYLMAGGRNSRSTRSVFEAVFRETGRPRPLIAYVGVASGDNWGFYLMISALIKKAGDCRIERVLISSKKADLAKAKATLESADAVFMSGGDVEEGMQVLKDKNLTEYFVNLYKSGKLFFGASAGTIMMAEKWVRWSNPDDDSTAELFPCLGISPLICDTHAEDDDWVELKAALKLEKDNTLGYGIPSTSCLKAGPDGTLEALGGPVVVFCKEKDQIVQKPDILPV